MTKQNKINKLQKQHANSFANRFWGCSSHTLKKEKIMNIILKTLGKLASGALKNLASVFAIIQALLKAIKELLTAVINLLFVFQFIIPAEKIQSIVNKIRIFVNLLDSIVEKIKTFFLKVGVEI